MTKQVRASVKPILYSIKMCDWQPLVLLPNVSVDEPIEIGQMALLPTHDPRITELADKHLKFGIFLERFTDAFGVPLKPSLIAARGNSDNKVYSVEAIASFRDAISASVIPLQQAMEIRYPQGHRILYSNTFAIYPWMIDRHYDSIYASTFGMSAIHDVHKFRGQSEPELPSGNLTMYDVDLQLLESLLKRWRDHYLNSGNRKWENRALFRSLNMANAAMRLPSGLDTTFYDVGRMIALWISAFEILAHPGNRNSGLIEVYKLLSDVDWCNNKSGYKKYSAYNQNKKKTYRNLACWLYGELHQARNDFLHGNPIGPSRLDIKISGRNLFCFVAPLYRLALTGFLPVALKQTMPNGDDAEKLGRYISEHYEFYEAQRTMETAIGMSRKREDPDH